MHNRRQFLVNFTMAAGAVSIMKPLQLFAGMRVHEPANSYRLTFLHTANLQGHWQALPASEKYSGLGGLQQLTKKIKSIRMQQAPVLLLDAGNMNANSRSVQEQQRFYKAASRIGYDWVVPGQTDLLQSDESYYTLASACGLPVSSHPTSLLAGIQSSLLPYTIFNKGSLQVAVIDASDARLKKIKAGMPRIAAISKTAAYIKEQISCAFTICILQEDARQTEAVATKSSHVDLIASAIPNHSIYNTKVFRNKLEEEVIVSYSGANGTMVNRIDLAYNEQLQRLHIQSKLELVGIDEDQYVASLRKFRLYTA